MTLVIIYGVSFLKFGFFVLAGLRKAVPRATPPSLQPGQTAQQIPPAARFFTDQHTSGCVLAQHLNRPLDPGPRIG